MLIWSKAAETGSKNYNEDWKDYWKNTELVPSARKDKQLPFLIETLKKELDINKIETVLEVGVGYGRVTKSILEVFPNIELYDGIDISDSAIEQSIEFVPPQFRPPLIMHPGDEDYGYHGYTFDFETKEWSDIYDMVISVETLSVVPHDIRPWIDKMISLSKKYVVNLDFTRGNDTITNNPPHNYISAYTSMDLIRINEIPIPNNESIFIVRVP